MLISAHFAYDQSPLEEFNVELHCTNLSNSFRMFSDHEVILKIDANTKVVSFEDG